MCDIDKKLHRTQVRFELLFDNISFKIIGDMEETVDRMKYIEFSK
jgi:hypothetical protein